MTSYPPPPDPRSWGAQQPLPPAAPVPNVAQYQSTYASYPPPSISSYPPPPAKQKNPWVSMMPPLVAGAFILLAISMIGAVAGAKAQKQQPHAPVAAAKHD
jgi:hypothetical protein